MVQASEYKFYMQEVEKRNGVFELVPETEERDTKRDIEADFYGCIRYSKAEGINTIGKPRVYTEKYSDSDRLRVYVPKEVTNDATKVVFTFYFFGDYRFAAYNEFNEYIRNGIHRYWDTARNRYFDFIVADEIKIGNERFYGKMPYFEVKYTVQNLNGRTFEIDFDY